MQSDNAAYTSEYLEYRNKHNYIFTDKYKDDCEEKILADHKHKVIVTNYIDQSHAIQKYNVYCSKMELYRNDTKVTEMVCIGEYAGLCSFIEHKNGTNYLLFNIDLYGYCVINLSDYSMYHYVPMDSFTGKDETFIWTNVLYCKKNNIIAVDGCYWASTFSTEFFDFSTPEKLPYTRLYNSFDMDGEANINCHISPIRWNEDGTIVLKCSIDAEGKIYVEKTIDIKARIKDR